jgi:hypothetical protein
METKEEYQRKFEAQVKEWNTLLYLLAAKMENAGADVKHLYTQELIVVGAKQRDAVKKIKELEKASDDVWDTIKVSAHKAGYDLGTSVAQAIIKFK